MIKIESTSRREIKEQTPHLTLLYCSRTARSSHRRCSIKKLLLKTSHYPWEAPVLKSLFKKVARLKACYFIKERPQYRFFPVGVTKFLRLPLLENICERLLFDCFNGSLLHGPKGSRSRLYDDIRPQGPSHGSSFLFLSWHLSSWTESRPALRRIPLMSQLSVYIGYFWSF